MKRLNQAGFMRIYITVAFVTACLVMHWRDGYAPEWIYLSLGSIITYWFQRKT